MQSKAARSSSFKSMSTHTRYQTPTHAGIVNSAFKKTTSCLLFAGLSTPNLYDFTLEQVCSAQYIEFSKVECLCVCCSISPTRERWKRLFTVFKKK